jgi:hypothetical protein
LFGTAPPRQSVNLERLSETADSIKGARDVYYLSAFGGKADCQPAIAYISDSMRELIEDLWAELVHSCRQRSCRAEIMPSPGRQSNKITAYGLEADGAYWVEFRTADGRVHRTMLEAGA